MLPASAKTIGACAVKDCSMVDLIQPLLNVSSHDFVQNLFAVLDRLIDDFWVIDVRDPYLHGPLQGLDNFQEMLVEFFRVGSSLWHMASFVTYR
jgi:hypothetical protein